MIPESTIDPLDMEALADVEVSDDAAADAIRGTVVIKLNGGLGTSMGMDRAKSLLCVRRGLSFLDIIARQVLHARKEYAATLPLIFMNSFRTSADTMHALTRYAGPRGRGPAAGVPAEQGAQAPPGLPRAGLLPQGPRPGVVPARARRHLHRAARHRPARRVDRRRLQARPSCPTPTTSAPCRTRASPAGSSGRGRRSRSRRCGARRRTRRAATSPAASRTAASCCARPRRRCPTTGRLSPTSSRHRFCSTNNLWFDLAAMRETLDRP